MKGLTICVTGFILSFVLIFSVLGAIEFYDRFQISLEAKPLITHAINSYYAR